MMTHKMVPATMMAVRILRALIGASSPLSQPSQSESSGRASRSVALMKLFRRRTFDDRDRGCAHPEKIEIRIFDLDADRESLRDAHPVQFALHIRNTCRRQVDLAFRLHRPPDSLHLSTKALPRRGREVNNRFAARSHISNFRFAKICDD